MLFVARPLASFFYSNLIKKYEANFMKQQKGDVAGEFYDTFEVGAAYRVFFYFQLVSVHLLSFFFFLPFG